MANYQPVFPDDEPLHPSTVIRMLELMNEAQKELIESLRATAPADEEEESPVGPVEEMKKDTTAFQNEASWYGDHYKDESKKLESILSMYKALNKAQKHYLDWIEEKAEANE